MKPKAIYYFILVLLVSVGLMACGGDTDDETEAPDKPTQSATTSSESTQPDVAAGRDIDFAAEEQAIRDLYGVYALAHGDQDVDVLGDVWLRNEAKDVFTAWTFWAGTFEKMKDGRRSIRRGRESSDCAVERWRLTSPILLLMAEGKRPFCEASILGGIRRAISFPN